MKNNLKIVFFGTPNFAVPVLRLLIESGYNISAVFAGHGPVSVLAQELKIKVFQPTSLKRDEQVFEEFKNLKPDICIVAAYGKNTSSTISRGTELWILKYPPVPPSKIPRSFPYSNLDLKWRQRDRGYDNGC